jgi:hypothetical protein
MQGTIMRIYRVIIAAVAVILIGLGVKLFFVLAPTAEARLLSIQSVSVDVLEVPKGTKDFPSAEDRRHDIRLFRW